MSDVYCVVCRASHEKPVAESVNDYCREYERRVLTTPGVAKLIHDAVIELAEPAHRA